ncbi:MAG: RNA polymerase sigma factor [Treponema sp.]
MFSETEPLDALSDRDFRIIYDNVLPALYKVAYNIVREQDAAEDLCHDAMIKMTEKEMQFRSLNDAKYWLIRVVKNASLNYAKRRILERKVYTRAFKEDNRKAESGESALLKNETVQNVKRAVEQLPEKLRVVLQLCEYTDLNYKEIGRILGISEGNVKVRIFRARDKLAKVIGEENVYMP